MKKYTFSISCKTLIPNVTRENYALIAVVDRQGKLLLGEKKDIYPEGISRLLGGGIEDENPNEAALRETEEELSIRTKASRLAELFTVEFTIQVRKKTYQLTTWVYSYQLEDEIITPADDISGVVRFSLPELKELVGRYEKLRTYEWPVGDDDPNFWHEYAKVYGPIHSKVYDHLGDRIVS